MNAEQSRPVPSNIPIHPALKEEHRANPTLVRDFILRLPHGLSLFYLCSVVLDMADLDPFVHGTLCDFLVNPNYGRFRDALVPRSFFKTSIANIGKSIWLPIRRDRNIKILIAMNTADNAEKRINTIRYHWEQNHLLRDAFPELVPDFKKVRWSNQCAELARTKQSDEGTYESIGSGGAAVSRHYDHVVEDDLVYAKKDDLKGSEIQPNREDIEKAIGWHKLVYSLFSDPNSSTIDNIGTKWAPHDLKDWITKNESDKFKFFVLRAETDEPNPEWPGHGLPVWPNRFHTKALKEIYNSQGTYMYYTQYMNDSRDPADVVFKKEWLQYYSSVDQAPCDLTYITIVDLASGWDSQVKGKGLANNVILTCGMDQEGHLWVLRYDAGKFNPERVIDLMVSHTKQFPKTQVWVEEVQYQKSVRFYAKKRMNETGYRYNLFPLEADNKSGAKDARIRAISNVASSEALHILRNMKLLEEEFEDYPVGRTKDILDCIGYACAKLRPSPRPKDIIPPRPAFVLEDIINDIQESKKSNRIYPFSIQCPVNDPFRNN